jgi:iron complex outermembrane receptor protein
MLKSIRKPVLRLIGALLLFHGPAVEPLLADAPGRSSEDLFGMSLQEVLDMNVTTASKLSIPANQSPGNIVVITQEQIRRYGYRTIGEALERVPGLLHSDTGFRSSLGLRGLAPQGFTSNARVLILIDGVRYNEWVFDEAPLNERFPLDIESVDRIEVLKGANSSVWGTNALYGVINVISKSGDSSHRKQVLGEFASHNREKGYASWGDETESGLKYFASASYTDRSGNGSAFFPGVTADPVDPNLLIDGDANGPQKIKAARYNLKMSYGDFYSNLIYGFSNTRIARELDISAGFDGEDKYKDLPMRAEAGYKLNVW